MIKNVLQNIENVGIWPTISFIIFFVFFLAMLWYVFTAKRSFIRYMKELPLNENQGENHETSKN
jgi:cbb3-type cytochrome oxidase subunit 3